VPTLVIVGDRDVDDVRQAAEELGRGIRGARLVVMPGVAHVPNMERPEEFNRLVLDFLNSLLVQ
jgi:2-hydroxy-6-oxonona-2,4-dienedioate hydrolase